MAIAGVPTVEAVAMSAVTTAAVAVGVDAVLATVIVSVNYVVSVVTATGWLLL